MPTVLSYTNAFPGVPFPGHSTGQSKPQNYVFPGGLQPLSTVPLVLSYTNALPGIAFPIHPLLGQQQPQNFTYPGGVQPFVVTPTSAAAFVPAQAVFAAIGVIELGFVGSLSIRII